MSDDDYRKRNVYILFSIVLLISFLAFFLAQNAQNTADNNANITNVFEIVVNNTNLAPSFPGELPGTGERVLGTVYFANSSPLQIFIYGHAASVSSTDEIHLFINGTKVADVSGRPLGGAESANRTVVAIIPKGANYSAEGFNLHHYEWREYPILSGRNGTLSVNQTFITNTTGSNYNASYVPYIGATQNITVGVGNFTIFSADSNSSIRLPNSSSNPILIKQFYNLGTKTNGSLSVDGLVTLNSEDESVPQNGTYALTTTTHSFKINNTVIATINKTGLDMGYYSINGTGINTGVINVTNSTRVEYYQTIAQSLPQAVYTNVSFDHMTFDRLSEFNGTVFTPRVSGLYSINANAELLTNANQRYLMRLELNGGLIDLMYDIHTPTGGTNWGQEASNNIFLNAGDKIRIMIDPATDSAPITTVNDQRTFIRIYKIG